MRLTTYTRCALVKDKAVGAFLLAETGVFSAEASWHARIGVALIVNCHQPKNSNLASDVSFLVERNKQRTWFGCGCRG